MRYPPQSFSFSHDLCNSLYSSSTFSFSSVEKESNDTSLAIITFKNRWKVRFCTNAEHSLLIQSVKGLLKQNCITSKHSIGPLLLCIRGKWPASGSTMQGRSEDRQGRNWYSQTFFKCFLPKQKGWGRDPLLSASGEKMFWASIDYKIISIGNNKSIKPCLTVYYECWIFATVISLFLQLCSFF